LACLVADAYPDRVPLVIDTYNVLHVTGVLPAELAVGEPDGLARLIEGSRFGGDAVWLVCDGVPLGATRSGRIVIEGAGPRRKADDHIAEIVGRSSAPRSMTVVTSDRELGRRVRSRGASVVKSEDFLAMLAEDARRARPRKPLPADPRRSVPLNEREVAGWMEVFRITAEQAAIEASAAGPRRERPATRAAGSAGDAALERFLEATKELDDPLSILDGKAGVALLEALGAIDDDALDALMKAHEPRVLKDGARIGGRKRGGGSGRAGQASPEKRSDA
jgi:hypothetical protein